MQTRLSAIADGIRHDLERRNALFETFFLAEAPRLARACEEMSHRFLAGGRLLAFGRGAAATDAQHVSVEFVHPVIVGKRALPAIDLGSEFAPRLPILLRSEDMVMGFPLGEGDEEGERMLRLARERGALTFSFAGEDASYGFSPPSGDPFVCQEIVEVLYHLLWETVHVYFEHREQGHDVGASSFLYPFLGQKEQPLERVVADVQNSMLQKTQEVNGIRSRAAEAEAEVVAEAVRAICGRLARGGKVITFGNGGSATDANDFMIDCVPPPPSLLAIPAVSLASEPANITAIVNDIGAEAVFARQLIAHARPEDIAVGISTSGSSPNILAALDEAGRRGLLTVAIVGYDGGKVVAERRVDHAIVARSDYIPRIQEAHASVYHVMRERIDQMLRER